MRFDNRLVVPDRWPKSRLPLYSSGVSEHFHTTCHRWYALVFLKVVLLREVFPGQWLLYDRLVLRAVLVVQPLLVETGKSFQLANHRWKEWGV